MQIKLELYDSEELKAFGNFCAVVGAARAEREQKNSGHMLGGLMDIVDRTQTAHWRATGSVGATAEPTGNQQATPKLDAAGAVIPAPDPALAAVEQPAKPKRGRPAKAETAPAIRTDPENRVDPETKAQDAADEQAEVAQTAKATLTHDDVRAALKAYLAKFGAPAAMEDGPKILGVGKISALGEGMGHDEMQALLSRTIDDIASACANNPYKRAEVAA